MPPTNAMDEALGNDLLAALPTSEFLKIRAGLEPIEFAAGDVLWESDSRNHTVYFPTSAIILLLYESENGLSVEVGIVGHRGLAGVSAFMADVSTKTRAVAFKAGTAFRMSGNSLRTEFSECGDFQAICLAYADMLLGQVTQSAACNTLHTVDQRLCRFLLHMNDEQGGGILRLTHEQISQALGVRRETISISARSLQKNSVIRYSRGKIEILDIERLTGFACECYKQEVDHYRRVLGQYVRNHPQRAPI